MTSLELDNFQNIDTLTLDRQEAQVDGAFHAGNLPVRYYASISAYNGNHYTDKTLQALFEETVINQRLEQLKEESFQLNSYPLVKGYINGSSSRKEIQNLMHEIFSLYRPPTHSSCERPFQIAFLDNSYPLESLKKLARKTYRQWLQSLENRPSCNEVALQQIREPVNLSLFSEEESTIYATHGGGLTFILKFLLGENRGYSLTRESETTGIFVSPTANQRFDIDSRSQILNRRDEGYACNTSYWEYLDAPCILKFKTTSNRLFHTSSGNDEAFLFPESVSQLENVEIIKISNKRSLFPHMPLIGRIINVQSKSEEFIQDLERTINKIKKQAMSMFMF